LAGLALYRRLVLVRLSSCLTSLRVCSSLLYWLASDLNVGQRRTTPLMSTNAISGIIIIGGMSKYLERQLQFTHHLWARSPFYWDYQYFRYFSYLQRMLKNVLKVKKDHVE